MTHLAHLKTRLLLPLMLSLAVAAVAQTASGSEGVPPADEGRPVPRQNPSSDGAGRAMSARETRALPDATQSRPIQNPKSKIQNSITLTVDTARPAQEILGFGVSGCWWAQEVGGWPEKPRREFARLLHDKQTGLGLAIYRHNLGADTRDDNSIQKGDRRTESVLNTKTGKFDWTRDAAARRIMRDAAEAGADQIILFVNSPPVNMTVNGHGRCTTDPEVIKAAQKATTKADRVAAEKEALQNLPASKKVTNLAPARHADFAAYLGEITEHFLRVDKLPIVAVSPVNEPGHPWQRNTQEGCFYTPQQTAALLKKILAEFKRRDLPVRIEPTDQESWAKAIPYFEAIHRDPELRTAFTDFCVHSYDSGPPRKRQLREWFDKHFPNARLHMSEWCEMRLKGDANQMPNVLPLARVIIEDLTIGRVPTWQYWKGAGPHGTHDSLLYYDQKTHTVVPNKLYMVYGQFTRYLAKGSVVLPVKMQTPADQVHAMAARLPDGRVAVIAANLSDTATTLNITFPKPETWRPQHRSLTDAKNNHTTTPPNPALPAKSVVTIIFEKQQ